MENKKSVLLYCDIIHTVEKLDNETAGLLFKHYLRYINDKDPITDNAIVDIAFEAIKQNLKRDLKKWEKRAERSRENGSKGGRPKNPTEPKEPSGLPINPDEPKEPVIVKDNVTVTDTVNVIKKGIEERKQVFITHTQKINSEKNILNDFTLTDQAKGFIPYWTEHGINDKKMKFEKTPSFDISRRLHTWKNNAKDFGNKNKNDTNGQFNQNTIDLTNW